MLLDNILDGALMYDITEDSNRSIDSPKKLVEYDEQGSSRNLGNIDEENT